MQPFNVSKPLRAVMLLSLLGFSMLGVAGCQTAKPPPLQISVPESLRAPCEHPSPEGVQTIGQLASYSVRQDAAISSCDARRSAVVAIVDGANLIVKPPKRKVFGLF